jgi:hypothetical protein
MKIETDMLGLAGEYRVCSELIKRGLLAMLTYGNRKSADVYVIPHRRRAALRIEVKTSQNGRFVTRINQKKGLNRKNDVPDFWVLFHCKCKGDNKYEEDFFILPHKTICNIQKRVNRDYARRYRKKHGRQPNEEKGVDNVQIKHVKEYRNGWELILRA